MRKTLLACSLSFIAFAVIGFLQWTIASPPDSGQELPLPDRCKINSSEVKQIDGSHPGWLRGWIRYFRSRNTQAATHCAPGQPARLACGTDRATCSARVNALGAPIPTGGAVLSAPEPIAVLTEHGFNPETQTGITSAKLVSPAPAGNTGTNPLAVSGHDENYTWITGVLTRKPGLANVWFIRYLPPDALPDLHNGCVTVQTNVPMDEFREGDLVTISGYIITNVQVAPNLRLTGYAAEHVCLVTLP